VSPTSAASEPPPCAVRGAASRKTAPSEPRGGSRRPAATLWTIEGVDGVRSAPLSQQALDQQVRSGQIDAQVLLKRQDWPAAKTAAELYQGLAISIDGAAPNRLAGSPFEFAPSPVAAPLWARLPDEPSGRHLPAPRRAMDRWKLLKLAILIVAALCGFWAFFQALGSFALQPALSRRILFLLYAGYWVGTALLAASLFDWRFPSTGGEPRGLRRRFGDRTIRYLLAGGGASIMLLILWLVF
jgi:hypothetical protein